MANKNNKIQALDCPNCGSIADYRTSRTIKGIYVRVRRCKECNVTFVIKLLDPDDKTSREVFVKFTRGCRKFSLTQEMNLYALQGAFFQYEPTSSEDIRKAGIALEVLKKIEKKYVL